MKSLTRLAGSLALVVALLPVALYALHVRSTIINHLDESLRSQGHILEEFIATQPQQWDRASDRMQSLLERHSSAVARYQVLNKADEVLIESAATDNPAPELSRSWPLHHLGEQVGRLTISRAISTELLTALIVLAGSLAIAWLIWSPLRRLPLRALADAEAALLARDQTQRALLDNFPLMVWLKDTESRFLIVNSRFAEAFEQPSVESLLGKTDLDITSAERAEAYRADDRAVLASGQPRRVEEWIESAGERRCFEIYKSPVSLGGKLMGTVGYARDITENKLAADALRESEERFRTVLDNVDSIALQGYLADGTTRFWNPASEKLYGYSAEEAIGRNLIDLIIPPEMRDDVRRLIDEMHRTGVTVPPGELSLMRKDGSRVAVFSSHVLLAMPGRPAEMFCIDVDLTESHRAAAELEQHRDHLEELVHSRTGEIAEAKEAAEAANRAKSTFLANMSHEIRTPMNAIIGLTHLLQQELTQPKQRVQLAKIGEAAQHLLGIIDDILDLSKIEAGRLTLDVTDFSLQRVIDHTLSMLGERSRAKGLQLVKEIDPAIPARLRGDPLRLGQILLNFVTNAVKFSDGGRITVRARLIELQDSAASLRLEVEDHGIGISGVQQAHLFHAFSQADQSTTRKYGGTGLGLAICKRLTAMMGGQIGVISEPGAGSTFWVTVGLGVAMGSDPTSVARQTGAQPILAGTSPAQFLAAGHQGARVLLAEDDVLSQDVARDLLLAVGLQVDVVDDGQQAVERLQGAARQAGGNDYALVLMDMQMPVMDGLEASRVIRQIAGLASLPIVAFTANAFDDDRQRCLAAGMNDHLAKPVTPTRLYEVLHRWLPTPTDLAGLPTALTRVPGLNPDAGLRATNGHLSLYVRLLQLFVTHHGDDSGKLRGYLAAGDQAAARRLTHTLKGVAGTIGAEPLRERARAVELAIEERSPATVVASAIDALEATLLPLLAAVDRLDLDQQAPAENPQVPVNRKAVRKILAQLESLLAEDDTRACDLWYESAALIETALGPTAKRLGSAIDSFDFGKALQTLRQAGQADRGRKLSPSEPGTGT
ncbi:ATP-binding protein [Accumulibacter sp.]|uniref:ATP-binding protein n=1 Tax=Accumulibacter sp. TaxID=2053492 RepID=UPI0028C476FC|nr:ATP-binding protein [Accumulibacter sp.]